MGFVHFSLVFLGGFPWRDFKDLNCLKFSAILFS